MIFGKIIWFSQNIIALSLVLIKFAYLCGRVKKFDYN